MSFLEEFNDGKDAGYEEGWKDCEKKLQQTIETQKSVIAHQDQKIKNLEEKLSTSEKVISSYVEDVRKEGQRRIEAEEVIAYYANYSTWMISTGPGYFDCVRSEDMESLEGIFNNPEDDIGGKRAREYQKKWEIK